MIKKFKNGCLIIEAIQFEDNAKSFAEIRDWVGRKFYYNYQTYPFVFLETSRHTFWGVVKDDWIVLSAKNCFEVYRPIHMEGWEEIK